MKATTITFIITLLAFILYSVALWETSKLFTETKIIRDTDTLITYRTIQDIQVIPKYTTIYKTDSVKTTDTLFVFDTSYVASLDTVYEDDTAKLKVDFVSDIPLSKKSYFNLDLDIKEKLVFVPTYVKDESFWYRRFGFFAGIGGVYTQAGQADLGLFIGFGIRLH